MRKKMIRHRGLEPDSWAPLSDGEEAIQLYNPYWRKFNIPADIEISPLEAGQYIVVITDATLLGDGSDGFYVNDPEKEVTLPIIEAVLEASTREGHAIALPMDEMYNRANDKDNRLTKRVLELDSLTTLQKQAVEKHGLEDRIGKPLTLKEFEQVFGDVKDKEFYTFIEHSMEGKVRLLPKFQEAVEHQRIRSTTGDGVTGYKVIPFQKDGLYPLVPPDEAGQGSNHWDRIFETWYAGRQGDEERIERKVLVCGACIDYSVELTAQWLKDTGYDPIVFAPAVKGLGFEPKPVVLRNLAEKFGIKVIWDWPSELGPEPDNWDSLLKTVKDYDNETFEYSGSIRDGKGVGSWKAFVESVETYQPYGR
jgi:hypothetical protein